MPSAPPTAPANHCRSISRLLNPRADVGARLPQPIARQLLIVHTRNLDVAVNLIQQGPRYALPVRLDHHVRAGTLFDQIARVAAGTRVRRRDVPEASTQVLTHLAILRTDQRCPREISLAAIPSCRRLVRIGAGESTLTQTATSPMDDDTDRRWHAGWSRA